ncbi:MAG TPA: putative sulfate exporter family transporter [Chloroflexota bacterium]|nr:putative sulfate exporter family transporter [Chloroflexota bacterium]
MSAAAAIAPRSAPTLPRTVATLLPGLALAGVVAAVARAAARFLPPAISEVLVAVLLGLIVANLLVIPSGVKPGVRFGVQRVLRFGIILLGARLSLVDVARIGFGSLGLVVLCMTVAFSVAAIMGRILRLPPRLAVLIGVGTAVCGNSAIIATAPVIEAEEREVSFAVGTITLFGTLAVFLYPLIGHALGLTAPQFGVWSGVAVNDTSQVIATSAAYAPEARDVAAVVKLVRNTLMAPLLLLIAWWWNRRAAASSGAAAKGARGAFPLFVLGFLGVALLRTVGIIDRPTAALIDEVAKLCILVALAGVGLSTRLVDMRKVGLVPFALGLSVAAALAGLSLGVIRVFGLGA